MTDTTSPKSKAVPRLVVHLLAMGAPAVGKSTLLTQFTPRHYRAHNKCHTFAATVVFNYNMYELRCYDVGSCVCFPRDNIHHWESAVKTTARNQRSAAYLLFYDATRATKTFQLVETLYKQLRCERPLAPMVVVAAKCDLIEHQALQRAFIDRLGRRVRNEWQVPHVQTSAINNWHVNLLFQELIGLVDSATNDVIRSMSDPDPNESESDGDADHNQPNTSRKCFIM